MVGSSTKPSPFSAVIFRSLIRVPTFFRVSLMISGVAVLAVGLIQFPVVPDRGATGDLHMHLHKIPFS